MTEVLQTLNPVTCEVSYDQPNYFVGAKVFALVANVWTQIGATAAATNLPGTNTYGFVFTPISSHSQYIVELGLYTDNTYSTYADTAVSSRSFSVDTSIPATLATILGLVQAGSGGGTSGHGYDLGMTLEQVDLTAKVHSKNFTMTIQTEEVLP